MHRCVLANEKEFSRQLEELVFKVLEGKDSFREENDRIREKLQRENDVYMERVRDWFGGTDR